MKKLLLFVILFNLIFATNAEVEPWRTKYDRRTRVVNYNPYQVYKIKAYTGFATMIVFAEDEDWKAQVLGDPDAWETAHSGRYLFLRPKADKASTNLFVLTNKRQYNFDLKAHSGKIFKSYEVEHFSIYFRYPIEAAKKKQFLAQKQKIKESFLQNQNLITNVDFISCGDKEISPAAAYDNSVNTFLKFAPGTEIPAIYYINEKGQETLANYNVDNDWIRIHRVPKKMILRRGQQVACLNNTGERVQYRTNTGTMSPDVQRVFKDEK